MLGLTNEAAQRLAVSTTHVRRLEAERLVLRDDISALRGSVAHETRRKVVTQKKVSASEHDVSLLLAALQQLNEHIEATANEAQLAEERRRNVLEHEAACAQRLAEAQVRFGSADFELRRGKGEMQVAVVKRRGQRVDNKKAAARHADVNAHLRETATRGRRLAVSKSKVDAGSNFIGTALA
jgi:hypothetical protein